MENKISSIDEKHLTRAIEKAATLATVNDSLDRNKLLADQMKSEGVDKSFAKVASAAFNKRITVLTFQKTADEHRSEPFQLTDDNVVYEMLGGEQPQTKAASVQRGKFIIDVDFGNPVMQKAASLSDNRHSKPNYEDTVDYKVLRTHIESMIDKQAAAFSSLTGQLESLDSSIKEQATALASYFQKSACGSFEFTTMVNAYGDDFKKALKDYLPADTDFSKTASAVVLPKTNAAYNKTAKLLDDIKAYANIKDFIVDYRDGLQEFCKSASKLSDYISYCEYHGFTKQANPMAGAVTGNLIRGISAAGLTGIQALEANRRAAQDALTMGFENARNMYNAGNSVGMAPGEVLDSDFLTRDRFRDRLLGWSDMSADPQFSMYPAEQVFQATHKVMDTDSSLERPDRREVLRSQVAQLLAQNNRQSTADIAALSSTLKALSATGGPAANAAAAPVAAMEKVDRPAPIEFKNLLEAEPQLQEQDYIGRYTAQMEKAVDDAKHSKERKEDKEERAKERTQDKADREEADRSKREQQLADRAEDRLYRRLQTEEERRYRALQAAADRQYREDQDAQEAANRAAERAQEALVRAEADRQRRNDAADTERRRTLNALENDAIRQYGLHRGTDGLWYAGNNAQQPLTSTEVSDLVRDYIAERAPLLPSRV